MSNLISILILTLGLSYTSPITQPTITEEQAKEELRQVVESIVRFHPAPFHAVPKETFYSKVDSLLKRTGEITVAQQYFDLAGLASLVSDTHTQLQITENTRGFDDSFPLRFKLFPDGLYVIAGNKHYQSIIGKKVISINGHKPEEVISKLANYSPSDNWPRKRVYAEFFLCLPETYDYFNLKTPEGKVMLELSDNKGNITSTELNKTWEKGRKDFEEDMLNPFIPEGLITVHAMKGLKPPFFLEQLDKNYLFTFLDKEKKYFYIQINQQSDEKDYHSLTFHNEWTTALLKAEPEIVIIDLRNDPGGQTNVGSGIAKFLEGYYYAYPNSRLRGVAVLLGYDTVSAGAILAAEIENSVWPVFIGEPSGSSPNMYLNAEKIDLPYSKLRFEVSKTRYISVRESDPRRYIAPDIPLSISFEDYLNGIDPLLEKAKALTKETSDSLYETAEFNALWKRESQKEAITY